MPTPLARQKAVEQLRRDLEQTVGSRLLALVTYEAHGAHGDLPGTGGGELEEASGVRHGTLIHTLAVIEDFHADDLVRLARLASGWERAGLALPLIFAPAELKRSLDAFPLEFAQILAGYQVAHGDDLLAGMQVPVEDLRRACEAQAKSHLVHLREGYLQTAGDPKQVAGLIRASIPPLVALLVNIARLHGVHPGTMTELTTFVEERLRLPAEGLRPLLAADGQALSGTGAVDLFPAYLAGVERLGKLTDEWSL